MDWPENTPTDLWVLPKGIQRDGLISKNPHTWTSKYGSLVAVSTALGKSIVTDGLNEKGLAVNALWLGESDYGVRDEKLPGLSISLWSQYCLDNFATVDEAIRAFHSQPYQIVTLSIPVGNKLDKATLHLSLEDKTGDSAIIEFINGKAVIHHDRNYTVMTNDPPYEQQLSNLKQYEGFGGNKPLPGTTLASDRFVRASYYLKYLPKPSNLRQAVAGVLSVTRNISQPFRYTPDTRAYASSTIWRSVADLSDNVYFYESTMSPNVVWVELNKFDLSIGVPAMKIDLSNNPDLSGDVTKQAVKSQPFEFMSSEINMEELMKQQKPQNLTSLQSKPPATRLPLPL
jgi:choloylglycine hydrolase